MRLRWLIVALLGCLAPACIRGQAQPAVVISEFMADNTRTLRDADGDYSDWIELYNQSSQPVSLAGWQLTDESDHQPAWTLPATNLPPGGFLLVFASGKNRAVAGQELHASFRLSPEGEYLALLAPNGSVATEFAPTYPAQLPDVSFGTGRAAVDQTLVPASAAVRVFVPQNDSLGQRWTGIAAEDPFDDSSAAGWTAGVGGVGFDLATGLDPDGPLAHWDFNSAANAGRAEDVTGQGRTGTVIGATYTADGGGFSGRPGDRALNLGNGAGRVVIPAAAQGAFDSATRSNALTVSLWIYGGTAQPASATAFWFTENTDGSGARTAQAHIPWSDKVIYWDTGNSSDCCSPAGRISRMEPDSTKWKGRWNHYVFLKRGDEKEIWQNGQLFLRGSGTYPLARIRTVTLGALPDGSAGFPGMIDDFALWDHALEPANIEALASGASPRSLSSYGALIGTDLRSLMHNTSASAYVRVPFQFAGPPAFNSLRLRVQYDAGFVAYLNGVEVARRNAASNAWNATATSSRSRALARRFEEVDLPNAAAWLRPGANVLAFQSLNESASDDSLLLRAELLALQIIPNRFLPTPSPGAVNGGGVLGFLAEPTFSVPHGYFTNAVTLELRSPTPGASLAYTTNGSVPSPTNGVTLAPSAADGLATGSLTLAGSTVLRATTFQAGFQSPPPVTQTYLFPANIARQPLRPAGLPASWADGTAVDCEMDPDVINRTLPGYGLTEALLAIPTVSLVADPRDLWDRATGIYANPEPRGDDWERPASVELLVPGGGAGFGINCGVHIHGNISRLNSFTPKHGFQLAFKRDYGPTDLEYPLFGEGVTRFDELVLKGLSTDTWPCVEWGANGEGYVRWFRKDASYIRDQWVRDAYSDMGQIGARGRFVHLFLNGLYWGIYNLTEHPSAPFQAAHYGGDKDEYDVLKDFAELDNGTRDAWTALMSASGTSPVTEASYQKLQGNNPDGTRNPAYPRLLNLENLIDYMILHIAIGADDWPNHNWWGARRRGPESEGFRFFPWDQEISINSLIRTMSSSGGRYEEVDFADSPSYPYARLRGYANFKLKFADQVQRHFFNGGALAPAANDARWQVRVDELDHAIVAESARWGDTQRATPYKREVEWLANNRWMRDQFWPRNHTNALNRFKRVGLYPNIPAPDLQPFGGHITTGFEVRLTASVSGTIHYTLDGSDPRRPNGTVAATARSNPASPTDVKVTLNDSRRVRARLLVGTTWSALTEAVFTAPLPLAITELMYHPPDQSADELARANGTSFAADDYEFIELQNQSPDQSLNLAGVKFITGVRFTFGDTTLAPLERIVLVRNRTAFINRYGEGIRLAGEYGNAANPALDSQLSNGGEELVLVDALDTILLRFTYSDDWQPGTDGEGAALELLDSTADLSSSSGWRAGETALGTPGTPPPQTITIQSVEPLPDGLRFTFEAAAGQLLHLEQTDSLDAPAWRSAHLEPRHATPRTVTVALPLPESGGGFFRLVAP